MIERLLSSGTRAVVVWGFFNAALAAIFFGFVLSGTAGTFAADVYAAAVVLVFGVALAVWLARHRTGAEAAGVRVPARPSTAIMLAVTVSLLWWSLAYGAWIAMTAVLPFIAAIMLELGARRS